MIKNKSIVAICVATYMRQSLLKNCLASIAKIKVPKNYLPLVIVVDNDKSNLENIKAIRYTAKSKKIAPDLIGQL